MSPMIATLERPRSVRKTPRQIESQPSAPPQANPDFEHALDKAMVAELSSEQIHGMERSELILAIHVTAMALPQADVRQRLSQLDRPTLERLAFLARRCCRNQGY